jgi:hypothetical protein
MAATTARRCIVLSVSELLFNDGSRRFGRGCAAIEAGSGSVRGCMEGVAGKQPITIAQMRVILICE